VLNLPDVAEGVCLARLRDRNSAAGGNVWAFWLPLRRRGREFHCCRPRAAFPGGNAFLRTSIMLVAGVGCVTQDEWLLHRKMLFARGGLSGAATAVHRKLIGSQYARYSKTDPPRRRGWSFLVLGSNAALGYVARWKSATNYASDRAIQLGSLATSSTVLPSGSKVKTMMARQSSPANRAVESSDRVRWCLMGYLKWGGGQLRRKPMTVSANSGVSGAAR